MNTGIDIKAHVTAGDCTFVRADGVEIWYRTALGFEFPVPVADMGEATFDASIRGMMMMRYVRRHAVAVAGEYVFVKAKAGNLWYRDGDGFEFPVPFAAAEARAFAAQDRGAALDGFARAHRALIAEQRQPATVQ